MSQKYLLVNSDNYENVIMTEEAYLELRLQMSTGDFHTHRAKYVKPSKTAKVIGLGDFYE